MKKMFLGLVGYLLAGTANAVLIDFDSLEVANSNLNYIPSGEYTEDGFTISGPTMYYAGQSNDEYAGSAGLHLRTSNATISLVDSTASVFSINSIGLSILNPDGVSPEVTFTGFLLGGGTVTQTFQPLSFGFSDFFFDASFSNLTSISWNQGPYDGDAHQFDNINLNVVKVPEPATIALLGLGLAGIGFARRKRPARPADF